MEKSKCYFFQFAGKKIERLMYKNLFEDFIENDLISQN